MKQYKYFTVIAEQGTLLRAASVLHISQPTLSKYLGRLEEELGAALFTREKNHLKLTPEGQIYYDACRKILEIESNVFQTLRHMNSKYSKTISISLSPIRGSMILADVAPAFYRRFPDIRLEICELPYGNIQDMLRADHAVFTLGAFCRERMSGLDAIIISHEEILLGVPVHYADSLPQLAGLSEQDPIDISWFANSPFILSVPGTVTRCLCDKRFKQAGFMPTVVFENRNGAALNAMICQGAGVGLLSRSSATPGDPRVHYYSLSPRLYLDLGIIYKRHRTFSTPERYLIYLIIQNDRAQHPTLIAQDDSRIRSILSEFS